jgi:hypothetical protein
VRVNREGEFRLQAAWLSQFAHVVRRHRAGSLGKYDAAISARAQVRDGLGILHRAQRERGCRSFTAKTREEADRVLEETIAKIAAKQAIERAKAKPES